MAFVKVQKSFAAHFAKFQRETAALHRKVICELLAGKGNVKFIRSEPLRLGGEVGHQLGARRALPHMRELFAEAQVFLGKLAEKIPDDAAVVLTGGRTHIQNALYVQEHCCDGRFGEHAYIQQRAGRAGIRGGKRLSRPRFGENVAVAPNILLHDKNTAREHKTDRLGRITGAEQKGVLRKAFFSRLQTG